MILRRIADGFVRQDWATVGVEFVIVVAGIFLGLQVNNWNELRMERAEERTNLERLLDEAENAVAYIGREVERGAARIAGHRELLETMFSDGPLPEDLTLAERGFMTLSFMPAMAPARTTYDELTAAGGLRLIRSFHVRKSCAMQSQPKSTGNASLPWVMARIRRRFSRPALCCLQLLNPAWPRPLSDLPSALACPL